MIEGNRIKFGYGDISVGANQINRTITFQQFKPAEKCGNEVPESVEFIGDEINLQINYADYIEFSNNLKLVQCKEIYEFSFKDYIFDFTNWNETSIKVCNDKALHAMSLYILCLAA